MDPRRHSIPEAAAYRILRVVLEDLRRAERTLTAVEQTAPDPERALHLVAIRGALFQLETFVSPLPAPGD
jgi:hypothetical protein